MEKFKSSVHNKSVEGGVSIPRDLSKAKEIIKDKYDARRLLAEEEIRESERKYRELYETVKDGIVAVDLEGKFLEFNQTFLNMLGYSATEIRKKRYQDITPKKWHKMEAKIVANQTKARGYSDEYEKEYIKKDGTIFPISIRAWLRKDREGKLAGTWAITRDITERKRAEEALRGSEERYRSLFYNMINGFAYCKIIVDKNNQPIDFVYLEVNDAFERLTGLRKEDVIGRKVTEAIPGTKESHPELFSIYGKVALTGEPTKFDIYFKPLKIWLTISAYSPQRGYFVAIFENITEHKRADEARAKAVATTAATIEGMIDVVGISDMEGRVIQINKAVRALGYNREEVIGKPVVEFIAKHSLAKLEEERKKTLKTGVLENLELIGIKKDGSEIPVLVNVTLTKDAEGKPIGRVFSFKDITERKQAEATLRGSEKRYRMLVETMNEGLEVLDENNLFTYVNDRFCEMLGYSRDEIIGRHITDFVDKLNQNILKEQMARRRKGERGSYEVAWTRKDGQKISTIISAVSILDADGHYKGSFAVITDITALKWTEEKIKLAVEEWETTFNSITDLVTIQDKDFKLVRMNKAYAEALKMKPEELIGKSCYEVVHRTKEPWPNCPHKQAMETKKTTKVEFFEPRLGIYLEISAWPIFDEKGEVTGTVHIAKDITERKRVEERLRKLSSIVDAMVDGVSITDLHGKITYVNQAVTKQLGYKKEELIGKLPTEFIAKKDKPKFAAEAKEVLFGKSIPKSSKYLAKHKDGMEIPMSVNFSVLRDYEGKPMEIIAVSKILPSERRRSRR